MKESNLDPIFDFHVVKSGAGVSTEVVPPKPKEMTASQLLKAQKEKAQQEKAAAAVASSGQAVPITVPKTPTTPTSTVQSLPTVQGISPNSVSAIVNATPSVVVRKVEESSSSTSTTTTAGSKGMITYASGQGQDLEQEAGVSCKDPTSTEHHCTKYAPKNFWFDVSLYS